MAFNNSSNIYWVFTIKQTVLGAEDIAVKMKLKTSVELIL